MNRSVRLAGCFAGSVVLGLLLSGAAFAQGGFGGGGGGGGGGFGGGGGGGGFGGGGGDAGGGFGGGGGGGFGGGGAGGSFGSEAGGGGAAEAFNAELAMPGEWRIEFRIEKDSSDPTAQGKWLTLIADVTISGDRVVGRIRDRDVEGDFECVISPEGRCEPGRLRFTTDTRDWPEFGFEIDDFDRERAEGWATFIDVEAGITREFELELQKR